jgi:hypothetical protein
LHAKEELSDTYESYKFSGHFLTLAFVNLASSRALKFFVYLTVTLDAQDEFPANTDESILLGHSFGGSTDCAILLSGSLNRTTVHPTRHPRSRSIFDPVPQIKAAAGFGTSSILRNITDDSIS